MKIVARITISEHNNTIHSTIPDLSEFGASLILLAEKDIEFRTALIETVRMIETKLKKQNVKWN